MAGNPHDTRISKGTSGFSRWESLGWSDLEEEGSWDAEDTAGGGGGSVEKESAARLGLVREDVAEVETEEDREEIGDGLGAAKEERRAEGDKGEEDFEMGDLGAEEGELVLEGVVLAFK